MFKSCQVLSVQEAAAELKRSESTIRRWLKTGKLVRNERGVTVASVDEEMQRLSQCPPSTEEAEAGAGILNRRNVLAIALVGFSGFVASGVNGGRFLWNRWKTASEQHENALPHNLFPAWESVQLVPGTMHPTEGYHPDVEEALDDIARLFPLRPNDEFRNFEDLPEASPNQDLLLIGGPVSNTLSRKWRKLSFDSHELGPSEAEKNFGLRWWFHYPQPTGGATDKNISERFSRYVRGKETRTWAKFLVDRDAQDIAREVCAKVEPGSLRIRSDVLLVTVIPNRLTPSATGSVIIDVADLHGQGDKMFARIIGDEAQRLELFEATRKKRFKYFQALYDVTVHHDDLARKTYPIAARLRDVAKIG